MRTMKQNEFVRGAKAAASVAEQYNGATTHLYRLEDCILAKLNIGRRKPRRNRKALRSEQSSWLAGFAVALAEMHKLNGGSHVREVARAAGLTLKPARDVRRGVGQDRGPCRSSRSDGDPRSPCSARARQRKPQRKQGEAQRPRQARQG